MQKNMNVLSLTRKLLSFNTINPPGQEHDCAKYVGDILENGGFTISYHEFAQGRTSLVAKIEGTSDKSPICFTGHIDTIPLGKEQWKKDPFRGEIAGDRLYGRGATDMKGGIAAMVIAALHVAKLSNRKAGITLVITASEETGCQGAYHLTEVGNVLGNAGSIIIGEPTSNFPYVAHKGALWLKAITTGITAHGSMPDKGVNAIYKAARAVEKLEKFNFDVPPHAVLGSPTLNVGKILGGESYNSVPDRAEIGIDIRTIPGQNNEDVRAKLQSYLGEAVELKRVLDVAGISTNPQHAWVQQIFKIMEKYLEKSPVEAGITYFTDGSVLTPAFGNAPTVILGPGKPEVAHKTDEYCHISKLEDATEAYREIAQKWCEI